MKIGDVKRARRHSSNDGVAARGVVYLVHFQMVGPALEQFVRRETLPGAQVLTEDGLLDYARRNGGTSCHASCTCMTGSHPVSVVDNELRVHGLDGLRVIDASVMPAVTSTNTIEPAIMIAERALR